MAHHMRYQQQTYNNNTLILIYLTEKPTGYEQNLLEKNRDKQNEGANVYWTPSFCLSLFGNDFKYSILRGIRLPF
jgi:hypothetical protein